MSQAAPLHCGLPMVARERKRDGHRFYGCSNYPRCRATAEREDPPLGRWQRGDDPFHRDDCPDDDPFDDRGRESPWFEEHDSAGDR